MRRRKRTEIRRTGSEEKSERRSFESLLHRGLRHPVNLSDSPSDSSTATGESTSIPREIKEIIDHDGVIKKNLKSPSDMSDSGMDIGYGLYIKPKKEDEGGAEKYYLSTADGTALLKDSQGYFLSLPEGKQYSNVLKNVPASNGSKLSMVVEKVCGTTEYNLLMVVTEESSETREVSESRLEDGANDQNEKSKLAQWASAHWIDALQIAGGAGIGSTIPALLWNGVDMYGKLGSIVAGLGVLGYMIHYTFKSNKKEGE